MILNNTFVERFKNLRTDASDGIDVSSGRKQLWQEVRAHYNLPPDVKFSVELDGNNAGELRIKGTGEAWKPTESGAPDLQSKPEPGPVEAAPTLEVVLPTQGYAVVDELKDVVIVYVDVDKAIQAGARIYAAKLVF